VRRLSANLGLKLISLALAIVLWLVVAGEKTSEIGLTVPVELQNLPKDLEVVGEAVDAVEVRLRATPAIVRRLDRQDIALRVDLGGVEEGEHFFHLTEQTVRRPFGVSVVRLSPSSLTLNLERTLTRELPIKARIIGSPAPGFEAAEIATQPQTVRVAGPRSRVQALANVVTEAISVDQVQQSVLRTVNIGIADPLVRIEGSPRVQVTVRVRERRETRVFGDVPVEGRGGSVRLRPARVGVVVSGPPSLVTQMTARALRPYVELGSPRKGALLPVVVEIASGFPGVEVLRVEPPEVTVAPHPNDPDVIATGGVKR
jgi:YbbR domain-containing protein